MRSELFGHRTRSFSGAFEDRKGIFERIGTGTVFIDRIDSMPVAVQASLMNLFKDDLTYRQRARRPRDRVTGEHLRPGLRTAEN